MKFVSKNRIKFGKVAIIIANITSYQILFYLRNGLETRFTKRATKI